MEKNMQITFLGTADGIPRPGHFRTSTMIEENGAIYLIDIGAPVTDLLFQLGKRYEDIRAIFNTHAHGDHLGGLLPLIELCQWAYTDAEFDMYMPEQGVADGFMSCLQSMCTEPVASDRMRMRVFSEGVIFEDENIKVTAIATRHCEPRPSYAFLVESKSGLRVIFTGDLGVYNGDFPKVAYELETNLIVCEMAHFGAEEIAPCLEKCKTKQVIFNHYQLRKERDIRALSQSGKFAFPIHAAEDMDVIEVY
jgi:ribonuclease BN (tRNA processing enzyme)